MIHQNVPASLLNKRIIALDIETTGLDIQKNTIIELGVVEIVNGKVTTEYKKLFGGGHSSMHLVRCVHHIADGERAGKKTFRECAQKIASYLSNAIVVTHNGNAFDIPMIEWNLRQAGAEWKNYKSVDTLAIMRKYRKANDDETDEKKEKVQGRNKLGNIFGCTAKRFAAVNAELDATHSIKLVAVVYSHSDCDKCCTAKRDGIILIAFLAGFDKVACIIKLVVHASACDCLIHASNAHFAGVARRRGNKVVLSKNKGRHQGYQHTYRQE